MSYRVEVASSARAGCRSSECLKNGVKIGKGELRMGVWVPFQDRGGWQWRHWGCVTGKQIENMRKFLEGEDKIGSGEYRWDYLDGYEGDEKNSLDKYPELQEKVRRCITQGFIDPEDFKGDPEMNKLGEVGLKSKETKQKEREVKHVNKAIPKLEEKLSELESEREAVMQEGGNNTKKIKSLDARIEKIKKELEDLEEKSEMIQVSSAKKLTRPQDEAQEETNGKTSKKRKLSERKDEDEDELAQLAPKAAGKRTAKKEEGSESAKTAVAKKRGSRAKKATKSEDEDEDEDKGEATNETTKANPVTKRGGRSKVKKEELDDEEVEAPPAKKAKSHKKSVKKEENDSSKAGAAVVKSKNSETVESVKAEAEVEAVEDETIIPGIKNEDLNREYKQRYKTKEVTGDFDEFAEQKKAGNLPEASQTEPKKTPKGRKGAASSTRKTRGKA